MVTINGGPIVWASKLQNAVALFTAEVELDALTGVVRESVWLRAILSKLGLPQMKSTIICQDNLGTIPWTAGVQELCNMKQVGVK